MRNGKLIDTWKIPNAGHYIAVEVRLRDCKITARTADGRIKVEGTDIAKVREEVRVVALQMTSAKWEAFYQIKSDGECNIGWLGADAATPEQIAKVEFLGRSGPTITDLDTSVMLDSCRSVAEITWDTVFVGTHPDGTHVYCRPTQVSDRDSDDPNAKMTALGKTIWPGLPEGILLPITPEITAALQKLRDGLREISARVKSLVNAPDLLQRLTTPGLLGITGPETKAPKRKPAK